MAHVSRRSDQECAFEGFEIDPALDRSLLLQRLYDTSAQLLAAAGRSEQQSSRPAGKQPTVFVEHHSATVKDLKSILQFRARRRRADVRSFLEWPAWDILLDLAAVRLEESNISVSSVCISSGAPQSTALRKLAMLESANLIRRYQHGSDRRRISVALTDEGYQLVLDTLSEDKSFFQQLGRR